MTGLGVTGIGGTNCVQAVHVRMRSNKWSIEQSSCAIRFALETNMRHFDLYGRDVLINSAH